MAGKWRKKYVTPEHMTATKRRISQFTADAEHRNAWFAYCYGHNNFYIVARYINDFFDLSDSVMSEFAVCGLTPRTNLVDLNEYSAFHYPLLHDLRSTKHKIALPGNAEILGYKYDPSNDKHWDDWISKCVHTGTMWVPNYEASWKGVIETPSDGW